MNDTQRLDTIEEVGKVTIESGRSINGGPYWTVFGGGNHAGGYETMREALDSWIRMEEASKR